MTTPTSLKNYPWKEPRIIELPHAPISRTSSPHSTTSQLVMPLSISRVFCGACGTPWSVNETFCGMCGALLLQEGRAHLSATREIDGYRFA
jgi:hypothetical protein